MYINEEVLKNNNLSIEEFMILYLNYKDFNIDLINDSLLLKGIADKEANSNYKMVLSNNTISLLNTILVNSVPKIVESKNRYTDLAQKLIEVFPEGKKAGTTYYWRGSISVIAERLKRLSIKRNVDFTDEEAIDAAKRYIQSFNGNYKYMAILKYFIFKNDNEGNFESHLLSYIENKNKESTINGDWTGELK